MAVRCHCTKMSSTRQRHHTDNPTATSKAWLLCPVHWLQALHIPSHLPWSFAETTLSTATLATLTFPLKHHRYPLVPSEASQMPSLFPQSIADAIFLSLKHCTCPLSLPKTMYVSLKHHRCPFCPSLWKIANTFSLNHHRRSLLRITDTHSQGSQTLTLCLPQGQPFSLSCCRIADSFFLNNGSHLTSSQSSLFIPTSFPYSSQHPPSLIPTAFPNSSHPSHIPPLFTYPKYLPHSFKSFLHMSQPLQTFSSMIVPLCTKEGLWRHVLSSLQWKILAGLCRALISTPVNTTGWPGMATATQAFLPDINAWPHNCFYGWMNKSP